MIIEPDIPNMSEVKLISIHYRWKIGNSTSSGTFTAPPYTLNINTGGYEMLTPVKVIYQMSNGTHTLYVHPNETSANDFKSSHFSVGAMMGYPKVTMSGYGVYVKIRTERIDYVPSARSLPQIKVISSQGISTASSYNNLYLFRTRDTELHLIHIYNNYLYHVDVYNPEPAVYPLVKAKADTTRDLIIPVSDGIINTTCTYHYHPHLTEVVDIQGVVNDVEVDVTYIIDGKDIEVTFTDSVSSSDEARLVFTIKTIHEGMRQLLHIDKTLYT